MKRFVGGLWSSAWRLSILLMITSAFWAFSQSAQSQFLYHKDYFTSANPMQTDFIIDRLIMPDIAWLLLVLAGGVYVTSALRHWNRKQVWAGWFVYLLLPALVPPSLWTLRDFIVGGGNLPLANVISNFWGNVWPNALAMLTSAVACLAGIPIGAFLNRGLDQSRSKRWRKQLSRVRCRRQHFGPLRGSRKLVSA